ncbi:SPOSA6832_01974, partial [Sporobolomyces salmonicolor]
MIRNELNWVGGEQADSAFFPPAVTLTLCHCIAFGAGNIPAWAYLENKAFRHGDIEDVLAELIKKSRGFLGRGSAWGGLDIKRVYFGNWLRDYSQAMDIAGLTKLSKQTIINLIMALGFLAHGYATGEFEVRPFFPCLSIFRLLTVCLDHLFHQVTEERLGVYLCTEHIDNPKADQPGGDARHVDPRLRPPVDPRELEIDPRTGMKNYIANESGTWDTSSRLVRERIRQCIDFGRRARNGGGEKDLYEAYRLLGTLLHTLEDFSAHSNWCELSLLRLGYSQVFCHVGDAVRVQSPAGMCPPLVTGSFGGSDFIHSLLGEATDHISEASVSDLSKAMDGAKSRSMDSSGSANTLRKMLFDLPGGSGSGLSREMQDVEDIRTRASNGQMNDMSPQELHKALWQVLVFRDNVVKAIESTIEKIPGLSSLVEKITNGVNAFVFTTIEPLLKPIMGGFLSLDHASGASPKSTWEEQRWKRLTFPNCRTGQATQVLSQGSAAVINNNDQYEVFNNPHASDPTHSFLAKDQYVLPALPLLQPYSQRAGWPVLTFFLQIAILILRHTVKLIVKAWDDTSMNPDMVASDVLSALHHPFWYDDSSSIQREMGAYLKSWIDGQSPDDKAYILKCLTKDSVRSHSNHRKGHKADQVGHGCGGEYNSYVELRRAGKSPGFVADERCVVASVLMPHGVGAFAQQHIPGASTVMGGFNQAQNTFQQFSGATKPYLGREMDGQGAGGFQEPPAGFMPPPGGPPQSVHGGAPSFDEFSSSSSSSMPQPSHYNSSGGGYQSGPSYDMPPRPELYQQEQPPFGGGGPHGYGPGHAHHHQPPHPPSYGGPPANQYGAPPQDQYGAPPPQGWGGLPPPPPPPLPPQQHGGWEQSQPGYQQGGYNPGYGYQGGGGGGGGGYY